jgi:hypothetical protein
MTNSLTILTDPIPYGDKFIYQFLKKVFIKFRYFIKKIFGMQVNKYRGHSAVTRSLVEGLKQLSVDFNYNPFSVRDLHDTVLVLSGVETLKQAIGLKKKKKIRKLFAGPNIVIFSEDNNNILASEEIDIVITPASIINELYIQNNTSLKDRIKAWPAGVDTSYWLPDLLKQSHQILIYEKQVKGPVGPVEPYVHLIEKMNYNVKVIRYGSYSLSEFLLELQKSVLMVGFVTDESQGIAWAEAWSTNVPTFLWYNDINTHRGRAYNCTTSPYLSNDTGVFFDDIIDFEIKFRQWERQEFNFEPRKWCIENMSDVVCAQNLLKIIEKC